MPHIKKNTKIEGVYEIESETFIDSRGFFINYFRSSETVIEFCWGDKDIKQINLSNNKKKGTIRGFHYQCSPNKEQKLIRCIKGSIWDVAVDLREGSPTYLSWHAVELNKNAANALLIPEGCAHGFQVLEQDSEVLYLHSGDWVKESEKGIRWNDPTLSVSWPLKAVNLSDRDKSLPFL